MEGISWPEGLDGVKGKAIASWHWRFHFSASCCHSVDSSLLLQAPHHHALSKRDVTRPLLWGGNSTYVSTSLQIERPKYGYHQCSTWGSSLAQGVFIELAYRSRNNSSIVVSPKFTPVWVTAHKSGESGVC